MKLPKGCFTGNEKGISTLEVLLAIVILGLVGVTFLGGVGTGTQATVITRDWHAVIESQLRVKHSRSRDESWQRLQKAYPMMFGGLAEHNVPFVVVSYEALVGLGEPYVDHVLRMLNLEPPEAVEDLIDGNGKYYE